PFLDAERPDMLDHRHAVEIEAGIVEGEREGAGDIDPAHQQAIGMGEDEAHADDEDQHGRPDAGDAAAIEEAELALLDEEDLRHQAAAQHEEEFDPHTAIADEGDGEEMAE